MAIAFRDKAVSKEETGATSLNVTVPAGVVNGDLMVLWIYCTSTPTITPPAGWTKGRDNGVPNDDQESFSTQGRMAMYYRIAASEPASYAFTFSASVRAIATVVAYSGALRPGYARVYEPSGTTTTIATAAGIIAPVENAWYTLAAAMRKSTDPGGTFTTDQGTDAERSDDTTTGGTSGTRPSLAVYDSNAAYALGTTLPVRTLTASAAPIGSSQGAWYTEILSNQISGTSAPIAYRGSSSSSGSGTNSTINVDASYVQNGDLIIAFINQFTVSGNITVPAGMTRLGRLQTGGSLDFSQVWYKIANSEPSTLTFTCTQDNIDITVVAYSGVNTSSPIGAWDSTQKTLSSNLATPTITTVQDRSWIVSAMLYIPGTMTWTNTSSADVRRIHAVNTGTTDVWDSNRIYRAGSSRYRTLTAGAHTGESAWIFEIRCADATAMPAVPHLTVKNRESGAWVSRSAVPKARVNGAWETLTPRRWNGSAWVDLL